MHFEYQGKVTSDLTVWNSCSTFLKCCKLLSGVCSKHAPEDVGITHGMCVPYCSLEMQKFVGWFFNWKDVFPNMNNTLLTYFSNYFFLDEYIYFNAFEHIAEFKCLSNLTHWLWLFVQQKVGAGEKKADVCDDWRMLTVEERLEHALVQVRILLVSSSFLHFSGKITSSVVL